MNCENQFLIYETESFMNDQQETANVYAQSLASGLKSVRSSKVMSDEEFVTYLDGASMFNKASILNVDGSTNTIQV